MDMLRDRSGKEAFALRPEKKQEELPLCSREDPCPGKKEISKEDMKRILTRGNELRFSKEIQDRYTEKDDTDWSALVTNDMYRQVLVEFGFEDSERMLDKVYSARWFYRNDAEMNEYFKTLIHVKFDLTGDGPLQEGDECPDTLLYELDGKQTSLSHYMNVAKEKGLPLVVIAGSWT